MNSIAYTAHLLVHVFMISMNVFMLKQHICMHISTYISSDHLYYIYHCCEVVGIKHVRTQQGSYMYIYAVFCCTYMIVTAILLLQVSHVCIVTIILYLPIGFQQLPPLDFPPYSRFNRSNNSLACSSKSMFLLITLELLVQIDILCSRSSSSELS